ncbi:SdpI family protein [Nocardia cyriacigeorgica]|uniref:SdpI family protein n=1 Tax=Nocardia cyriacigeorgica TaxID=135487 RepID=UPI001895633E|nr:SdpI family protein [Nocardia cyriacigeorgica]MBF6289373.1 SdpI family protein [Nocardia cyriacigeorgica]
MVVVPIILFLLAAVALAIGVLGLVGKLPRNRFVGVHTDEALSTDEVFRVANRVAAPTSLAAGALLFCGGLVTLAAGGFAVVLVALGVAIIALFTLGAGATAGARAAAALALPAETGGCGNSCGACSLRDTCQPAV